MSRRPGRPSVVPDFKVNCLQKGNSFEGFRKQKQQLKSRYTPKYLPEKPGVLSSGEKEVRGKEKKMKLI